MIDLTDEERQLVGFALACYLEDLDKRIKKTKSLDMSGAIEQRNRIEFITYTKIIPEAWCGPKPSAWK